MYNPAEPLKVPRQESFARLVATGHSASDAYSSVGYRPNSQNASNLLKKCQARVDWLKGQALERTVQAVADAVAEDAQVRAVTRDYLIAELQEVLEKAAGKRDVIVTVRPRSKKGAKELVQVALRDFKPAAACRAAELLGKAIGMFDEDDPARKRSNKPEKPPLSKVEFQAHLRQMLEEGDPEGSA